MIDSVLVVVGILVVLATLVDMVATVLTPSAGHGVVSSAVSRNVWALALAAQRRIPKLPLTAAAGPVTSVGSVEVTGSDLAAESVAVAEPAEPADSPGSAAPAGGAGSPGSPTSADRAPGESQGPTNAGQDTSSATTDGTKEP